MSATDWRSYDDIASLYDSIAVPHYFEPPARHLVRRLGVRRADRLLDLGAGTGITAALAQEHAGSVIAADPSWPMLRLARARAVERCVASALPRLAFGSRSFDCVTASFVLNHIPDLDSALQEMVRVLRGGGRLGVTSWSRSPSDNEIGRAWTETAHQLVSEPLLDAEVRRGLPNEQRLSSLEAIRELLSRSELSLRLLEQVEFPVAISTQSYLASRSVAMTARLLKSRLPAAAWQRFEELVAARLWDSFGAQLHFSVCVNVAVAVPSRTG
jgi:ubiquinone/menaquinone biosynthesis C-methylase UbiE